MQIKAQEITALLEKQIRGFDSGVDVAEVGTVIQVGDGIAILHGLKGCMVSELLEFPGGLMGLALNLERDTVGAVLLGSDQGVKEGDTVRRTGRVAEIPVGKAFQGRVVNALGVPIDGKGPIAAEGTRPIELRAAGVIERQPVKEPLATGIKAIDGMIPIGRGQRELIIGDRQTGKNRCRHRYHHQSKRQRRCLRLCGDWPKAEHRGSTRAAVCGPDCSAGKCASSLMPSKF